MKQAAQMGIPGITAHRAVHVGASGFRQDRQGQIVLVQGGSGAVGQCAIAMAKKAGARTLGGLPMLIYQGAAAFTLWTGLDAPVDIMTSAARKEMGH